MQFPLCPKGQLGVVGKSEIDGYPSQRSAWRFGKLRGGAHCCGSLDAVFELGRPVPRCGRVGSALKRCRCGLRDRAHGMKAQNKEQANSFHVAQSHSRSSDEKTKWIAVGIR